MELISFIILVVILIFAFILSQYFRRKHSRNRLFIANYNLPQQNALYQFREAYPNLSFLEEQEVINCLKIFFIALTYESKDIILPSKIVSDLWEFFSKDTLRYQEFCNEVFGETIKPYECNPLSSTPPIKDIVITSYRQIKKAHLFIDPRTEHITIFNIDEYLQIKNGIYGSLNDLKNIEQVLQEN